MYSNMGHSLTTPFFSYYFPRFGRLYGEGCDGLEAEDTLGGSSRIDHMPPCSQIALFRPSFFLLFYNASLLLAAKVRRERLKYGY